jgi:hypothetical protein
MPNALKCPSQRIAHVKAELILESRTGTGIQPVEGKSANQNQYNQMFQAFFEEPFSVLLFSALICLVGLRFAFYNLHFAFPYKISKKDFKFPLSFFLH